MADTRLKIAAVEVVSSHTTPPIRTAAAANARASWDLPAPEGPASWATVQGWSPAERASSRAGEPDGSGGRALDGEEAGVGRAAVVECRRERRVRREEGEREVD